MRLRCEWLRVCGRGAVADDAEVVRTPRWSDATVVGRHGVRTTRCADDAVCGCSADDAEVVPPRAEVATGFTPGRIARTDRSQGHNRGINPLATWKCGRRGGRPSPGKCRPPRAETPRCAVAEVSGCSADDAEVVPPGHEAARRVSAGCRLGGGASASGDATIRRR